MKLLIHLVTWNGSKYIPYLFDSLRKQTFHDFKLIILDNASSDNTVEKIKKELEDFPFEHELILNKENLGFAGGHNQLWSSELRVQSSEFVLLLNQDMYLTTDCLEKLVQFADNHKDVAAISPRLMRWDFNNIKSNTYPDFVLQENRGNIETSFTNQIDSLGLKIFRNRRVIEKYAGKDWEVIKPKMILSYRAEKIIGDGIAIEVFGVSGALPMFRVSALEVVKFADGNIFDCLYNSYKEDVDLAYRLRQAGLKSFVILDAVAYHDRSAASVDRRGDLVAIENKKKQSEWVRYHSYKNHLMNLIKNEYWQNFLLDLPWIKWYEIKKFCYFLFFDRKTLKGLKEIIKNKHNLKNKRLEIINRRKVSWREIRKWWV